MANRLKMALVDSINTLVQQGLSQRKIARLLGVDRQTVRRHVRLASNPARAPTGSPAGSSLPPAVQPSACEPYRDVILAKLDGGLTAQRVWQDLVSEYGFAAKYHSVRRYVRKLTPAPLPFRRMECEPGAEAQVDFGTGATVVIPLDQPLPAGVTRRRRKTHVFRIVLSYSRKAYSEAVYRQTAEDFIRALENAFWAFGGVPRTLVIDNLKAAVAKADWFDPELNPKIQSFCTHYGTVILPTQPRMPRHKGKIEAGVKYVQSNALKGRTFESLAAQNSHLDQWERAVADTRIHGTTQTQVLRRFEEAERPALLPLPAMRFPSFQEARRIVNRDGHVEVARAYYSVPPEYLGREVWARWDGRTVHLSNTRFEVITVHVQQEPGRFSTLEAHVHPRKRSGVERGAAWLLSKASAVGPRTQRWAEQMIHQRGIQGVRILQGLLSLAGRHPADAIERACEIAARHGAYRLRTLRQLMDRQGDRQEQFEFLDEHPIIRPVSEYAQIVRQSLGLGDTRSAGFPEPLPGSSFPSPEEEGRRVPPQESHP
jgi:transposase